MSYSYDINHLCDITNTECSSKGSEMQSTSRTAQRPPEPTLVCFWTGALPGTLKCSCTEAKIQPRQAQWRGFWAHPWPGNGEHKLPLRCAVFMWGQVGDCTSEGGVNFKTRTSQGQGAGYLFVLLRF